MRSLGLAPLSPRVGPVLQYLRDRPTSPLGDKIKQTKTKWKGNKDTEVNFPSYFYYFANHRERTKVYSAKRRTTGNKRVHMSTTIHLLIAETCPPHCSGLDQVCPVGTACVRWGPLVPAQGRSLRVSLYRLWFRYEGSFLRKNVIVMYKFSDLNKAFENIIGFFSNFGPEESFG